MILLDGNGAIYPLAKDCSENIRDPIWLDLPPVTSVAMKVQKLSTFALSGREAVLIIAFTVKVGLVCQHEKKTLIEQKTHNMLYIRS